MGVFQVDDDILYFYVSGGYIGVFIYYVIKFYI